jgi:poly(3-hydroxybutyrate) depolymerase
LGFYNNSGFVTDTLAKEFGALVIFGEHRYYGKSMPFNEKSYLIENLKYLTIEQIMADYVKMIKYIKNKYSLKDSPVYVVGGSYGGMLAAWLRMKYPITFDGALASSAPILHFKGSVNPN